MTRLQKNVIDVIRKPSSERALAEIQSLLPWLRKRSKLLNELSKEVLIELVRQCKYQKVVRDDVIIQQEENGDRFYLVIDGAVSVYIADNQKNVHTEDQTGPEDEAVDAAAAASQQPIDDRQDGSEYIEDSEAAIDGEHVEYSTSDIASEAPSRAHSPAPSCEQESDRPPLPKLATFHDVVNAVLNRKKFGKFVNTLGPGQSFGEVALLTAENVRTASVVADQDTDLLIVHADLYNNTIREYQEKDYAERMQFVQSHAFFRKWTERHKRMLVASLVKETYTFDTPIVTQGDYSGGLVFITKGHAKVVVEPRKHNLQYPQLTSARRAGGFRNKSDRRGKYNQYTVHRNRRTSTCAATKDSIVVCTVQAGEIIGDTEFVSDLPTYAQTVVCTSSVEMYQLNSRNTDRLITRGIPATILHMRKLVEQKLLRRTESKLGSVVPLYRKLITRLRNRSAEAVITTRPNWPVCSSDLPHDRRRLPDKETLFLQQLQLYAQDKATLAMQYVAGGIYYRKMAREKAEMRDAERNRQQRGKELAKQFAQKLRQKARTMQALRRDMRIEERMSQQRFAEQEQARAQEMNKRLMMRIPDIEDTQDRPTNTIAEQGVHSDAPPTEQTTQPASDEQNISLPNSKWQSLRTRIKDILVNDVADETVNSADYDWETSDKSLDYLEKRIEHFTAENGNKEPYVGLPKLKRFKPHSDDRPVRPGGKVVVQRRFYVPPKMAYGTPSRQMQVHVRHHMLPKLPNYDELRQNETISRLIADRQRAHWLDCHVNR